MAVRKSEFRPLVRQVPFVALPREEIERLYAALEVLAVDEATLRHESEFLPLHSHVAVHHNYWWLTFRHDHERTLLLSTVLSPDGSAPLFLGEQFVALARRQVGERLGIGCSFEVRLAGILQEPAGGPSSPPQVGLLSIARLTERPRKHGAECCGNGELRLARSGFDPSSQVVIDHLAAL